MNWANRLTLSRLVLTVLFVLALNSSWQYARTCALVIFVLPGLENFFGGENPPPLRSHHKFWQTNGSAGGQDHDGSGLYFAGASESCAGVGGHNSRGARLFDYRSALDGQRQRPGFARGLAREAKNLVANHYGDFFPGSLFGERTAIC